MVVSGIAPVKPNANSLSKEIGIGYAVIAYIVMDDIARLVITSTLDSLSVYITLTAGVVTPSTGG